MIRNKANLRRALPEIHLHDFHPSSASLVNEVLAGLSATPKVLPPKLFYDHRGAELFERICELPEYYLTRTEIGILRRYGTEIAAAAGTGACVVELGSGAGAKVRLLLDHLRPRMYVPIDIARLQLQAVARDLATDYPWIEVHPVCADYCRPLRLAFVPRGARRLVYFPGSTLSIEVAAKNGSTTLRVPTARFLLASISRRIRGASRPPTTTPPASPPNSISICSRACAATSMPR